MDWQSPRWGQTVLPDLPADAAGQRQSADTYALGVARGDRPAMRGQGGRALPPGGAAADPHEVTFVVDDLHGGEPAEVDHDAAVVGAEARKAMAAASHGQQSPAPAANLTPACTSPTLSGRRT